MERWDRHGVPPLCSSGDYVDGPLAGWFFYRDRKPYPITLAYCPTHSGPAVAWRQAHREWAASRRQVAVEARSSLVDKLARAICPDALYGVLQTHTAKSVSEWRTTHAEPLPPWRRS